jgi:hypothetical protein
MKTLTRFNTIILILIITALAVTGCPNPDGGSNGNATISINLGGGSSSFARTSSAGAGGSDIRWPPTDEMLANMTYEITLTGSGQVLTPNVSGGTITITVTAGLWNVGVDAFYRGQPYATGTSNVNVIAGQNHVVNIIMIPAGGDGGSGDGTIDNPFRISTEEQLAAIGTGKETLNKHYKLVNNIDLTGINWTPIGNNDDNPFIGTFDGDGLAISGLSASASGAASPFGLFGVIGAGATVKNVRLENVDINVPDGIGVGSLVGVNNGTVRNSSATGEVGGNVNVSGGDYVGGLVGVNLGTIQNSSAAVSVSGTSEVGGLVGVNNGTVLNSSANGDVRGTSEVGGLVGFNNQGTVEYSYATSIVIGNGNSVGGLVGLNDRDSKVKNSYATGDVSGGDYVGGLVGFNNDITSTVENSYATGNVRGNNNFGGLVGYNNGIVRNSVALNLNIGNISGMGANLGRVVGSNSQNLTNNYGRSGMQFNNQPQDFSSAVHNEKNGANVTSADWYNPSWWSSPSYGWNTTAPASAWDFSTNGPWDPPVSGANPKLPTLRGPGGEQNPQVRD